MAELTLKKNIDDIWPVAGKRFIVRVDFNVPIKNGIISNDYRIRSALPTIRAITENGGICILISHLGRHVLPRAHDSVHLHRAIPTNSVRYWIHAATTWGVGTRD